MFTGVCLSTGGLPGPGGCLVLGVPQGRCLVLGGACCEGGLLRGVWGVPVGDPPGMATAAGGTHPTEMYSCMSKGYNTSLFMKTFLFWTLVFTFLCDKIGVFTN